jgi:head-tail adaptor
MGRRLDAPVNVGRYRQVVALSNPSSVADGDGGFTQSFTPLSPATAFALIRSARGYERVAAGTVIAQGTFIVEMRFHPGITAETRVQWTDRANVVHTANVSDIDDVDQAGVTMKLTVVES